MNHLHSIRWGLASLCVMAMQPAHALQATAWIDLSSPLITYTDLDQSDGIAPAFTVSGIQFGVSVWEYAGYSQTLDGRNDTSNQWPGVLNVAYTTTHPPGATGEAGWSAAGIGSAILTGHVDGGHMNAGAGFYAAISLTPMSSVQFSFPGHLTLDATGHDNLRQAYATLQGYVQTPDYAVPTQDYLRLESWFGNGDLSRDVVLTLTNPGTEVFQGTLSITGAVDTVSTAPEPETWAMLLAGLGLVGWAARQRG